MDGKPQEISRGEAFTVARRGVGGGCTSCFLKSTKGPTGELEVWSLEPGEEVYIGGLAVCQWPGFYKVLYMRGR